jgi:hypothetical protein
MINQCLERSRHPAKYEFILGLFIIVFIGERHEHVQGYVEDESEAWINSLGYGSRLTGLGAQLLKSITGLHALDALRARSKQNRPVHDFPSMEHGRVVF